MIGLDLSAMSPGQFDFGLSEEEEARAAMLHRESIVFDMLCMHGGSNIFAHFPEALRADLQSRIASASTKFAALVEAIYWPYELASLGRSDLLFRWFHSAGLTCGAYEVGLLVFDERDLLSCNWDARIMRYAQLPWLRYVTTAAEIRRAKADGVVALYANCQPIIPAPRDLNAFNTAYAKGLRSFMLTYNRMDHIGVGCTERVDAGLSMFGLEVVKRCNDLGIIVDVSHCGHMTTMEDRKSVV